MKRLLKTIHTGAVLGEVINKQELSKKQEVIVIFYMCLDFWYKSSRLSIGSLFFISFTGKDQYPIKFTYPVLSDIINCWKML